MAVLTISREFGSGGKEIGQAVAQTLGYGYVDKEAILREVSAVGEQWRRWTQDLDEHGPTLWERYDWSFMGISALIQDALLNRALQGNVVLMGRGAGFLLKGIPFVFRARVVAPLKLRLDRVMKRESVDHEAALQLIERTEKERAGFLSAVYGTSGESPEDYDAVFNTGKQSLDEVVRALEQSLADRDRFNTEENRRLLSRLSLITKAKVAVFTNPSFLLPTLQIEDDGRQIILRGTVHNPKEHERLESLVKSVVGDLPMRCELQYRT